MRFFRVIPGRFKVQESEYLAKLRRKKSKAIKQIQRITPRRAAVLIGKPDEACTEEEKRCIDELIHADPSYGIIRELTLTFKQLMRERHQRGFYEWLDKAESTDIKELQAFARGLRRDLSSVAASLCEPWSSGQVEGHIHRLKLIKRQMYGRAKFDLLRQRVLYRG